MKLVTIHSGLTAAKSYRDFINFTYIIMYPVVLKWISLHLLSWTRACTATPQKVANNSCTDVTLPKYCDVIMPIVTSSQWSGQSTACGSGSKGGLLTLWSDLIILMLWKEMQACRIVCRAAGEWIEVDQSLSGVCKESLVFSHCGCQGLAACKQTVAGSLQPHFLWFQVLSMYKTGVYGQI